jgi:hypothetical protein
MMNKSLRAGGRESSHKRIYGFQHGDNTVTKTPKKRATVSGGF